VTASSLPYPLGGGGRRFVGAALVVLVHFAALWAFVAAPPPLELPEDKDLQTLLIQDIAIAPPPPPVVPQALEKVVEAPLPPPPAPVRESVPEKPAPAATFEPVAAPVRPVAVVPSQPPVAEAAPAPIPVPLPPKSQVPVVASEPRSAAPAKALSSEQFPAAAAPVQLYPPSAAHQGPLVAEAPRIVLAVPASAPAPAPALAPALATASPPASVPPVAAAVASTASAAQGHAIDALCPPEFQVKPEMPVNLTDLLGDEWVVRANITIRNDTVTDIRIISGPKVLHDNVRKAIRQYRCKTGGGEVVATQTLRFKLP